MLTVFELSCYTCVAVMSCLVKRCKWDFVAVVLLAAAIIISFSGLSYSKELFSSPIFSYMGKFSLSLYLNHVLWIKVLRESNLCLTHTEELIIVWPMIITASLMCMFATDTLLILYRNNKQKIKSFFVKEEAE